jgi:predicted ATPase
MRLDEVTIGAFKNLENLTVDFDEKSPYTVLVGENGAGKSNLLEALTLIFRHLDLEERAPFCYSIKYRCRDWDVHVIAGADDYPRVEVRDLGAEQYRDLPRRRLMDEDAQGPLYRPAFVFGYYSGPSDRLAGLFNRHRERFYDWIIQPADRRRGHEDRDANTLRRLFYAENLHGQFALIAFFMDSGPTAASDRNFLREQLQIDGLDSVLFVLKRPPWRRPKGGDPRFWNAVGDVQAFLARLYEAAYLPARMPRRIQLDLTKNPSVEHLYLFLPDPGSLESVYESYGNQYAFFTALESMHLSKLLGEVRTRVRMTPRAGGGKVTYRDLSEGEQQLLLVLGLLKFTARDETLFLLDEPDTHLNPVWSTRYLEFLDRFILGSQSSHVIMTTHDPLVFAGLTKPQVRVFERDQEGHAQVSAPLTDPKGMGIQAILASELFRLPSGGLDRTTLLELDVQRRLASRSDLSLAEQEELHEVTERLNDLGFWKSDRDPLYQLFLEQFVPRWEQSHVSVAGDDEQLTVEQTLTRHALAAEISAEIASEQDEQPQS